MTGYWVGVGMHSHAVSAPLQHICKYPDATHYTATPLHLWGFTFVLETCACMNAHMQKCRVQSQAYASFIQTLKGSENLRSGIAGVEYWLLCPTQSHFLLWPWILCCLVTNRVRPFLLNFAQACAIRNNFLTTILRGEQQGSLTDSRRACHLNLASLPLLPRTVYIGSLPCLSNSVCLFFSWSSTSLPLANMLLLATDHAESSAPKAAWCWLMSRNMIFSGA